MGISLSQNKGMAARTKARLRRQARGRKKIFGSPERPRLVVTRSSRHLFAQVIDDAAGTTLASASTMESGVRGTDGDKTEPTKPSIDAVALPDGASELLKAMPDSVLNYARTKADASTTWSSTSPVEEYALTYSTGKKGQDVTLEVGQWNDGDKAKSQYDTLAEAMTGKELGSGNVKVSGKTTGAYSAKADPDDDTKAVAVWRNDTVVFYATGAKNDIQRFYQQFPL